MKESPQFGHYDAIILGSSLPQCALSGALSLAGKKVLHIDQAKRYGGCQADFKLRDFIEFLKTQSNNNPHAIMRQFKFSDTSFYDNLDQKQKMQYSRKFTIELMPLVLFSRSCSVDFLISSGCSNYLQFNTVNNNYFVHGSHIYKIPYSKSEIFLTNDLDLKQKHELSKVISNCMHFANKQQEESNVNSTHTYDKDTTVNDKEQQLFQRLKNQPIRSYFTELGVKSKIVDLLLYAIAFVNQNQELHQVSDKITTLNFFKRMAKYLKSIGYFGDSPMIMSQYGSSEYLQAFSRLSAVFGGMFVISDQVTIQNLIIEEDKCISLQLKGLQDEPTTAEQFFLSREYQYLLNSPEDIEEPYVMSHMIIFSRQKLIEDLGSIGMIVIAPMHEQLKNQHPISILQQSSWSNNMPDGEFLFHCSMLKSRQQDKQNNEIFDKLRECLFRCFKTFKEKKVEVQQQAKEQQVQQTKEQQVQQTKEQQVQQNKQSDCEETKSSIFFYCTYNQHKYKKINAADRLPKNLFMIECSDYELDLDTDLIISQNLYYKAMGQNTEHLFLERKKQQQQQQDIQEQTPSEDNAIDFLLNELNDI